MNTGFDQVKPERCKIIACATVMKEMRPLLPPEMRYEVLEAGLHINPGNLKQRLQQSIELVEPTADIIILGYGLCALAVVGLMSKRSTIILPRVDDCTAIFLGSGTEYLRQHSRVPGTLYMSKGWLEAGVFGLPVIVTPVAHPVLAAEIRNRSPGLSFFGHLDNLLFGVPFAPYFESSRFLYSSGEL